MDLPGIDADMVCHRPAAVAAIVIAFDGAVHKNGPVDGVNYHRRCCFFLLLLLAVGPSPRKPAWRRL